MASSGAATVRSADMDSVEEFNATLVELDWDSRFSQLDPGPSPVLLKALLAEHLSLMQVEVGCRAYQAIVPPTGTLSLGIPARPQRAAKIGSQPLPSESVTVFSPNACTDVVSDQGFGAYTVSFEMAGVRALRETCGLSSVPEQGEFEWQQQLLGAADMSALRLCLSAAFCDRVHTNEVRHQNVVEAIQEDLLLQLLVVWERGEPVRHHRQSGRSLAVGRALDYIRSHPRGRISIPELCLQACCSIRTLERSFQDYLGVSPKQYLMAYRLTEVRRHLLESGAGRSIGDVAADCGFWHMSHFASSYQRFFGELPSSTRLRGNQRHDSAK